MAKIKFYEMAHLIGVIAISNKAVSSLDCWWSKAELCNMANLIGVISSSNKAVASLSCRAALVLSACTGF